MPDFTPQAEEAIRSAIADWRDGGDDNWGNIIPGENWGMNIPTWQAMLDDILDRFAAAIAPCGIPAGQRPPRSRTRPLYVLVEWMVAQAVCPDAVDV